MLSGNVKINRLQSIIKHFKSGWYVCVFNRFDLLNKMTLEETRVDTPKISFVSTRKTICFSMNGKGRELELVVHTVGREGLGTLNPNLFFPIRSHRA